MSQSTSVKVKAVVGACLLGVSGLAVGYGCPPVMDPIWQAAMTAAKEIETQGIEQAETKINEWRKQQAARVVSAIKAYTKQVYEAMNKLGEMEIAARNAHATSNEAIMQRERKFEVSLRYDRVDGQGYDPCNELDRAKKVATAVASANQTLSQRSLSEIDAAPGAVVAGNGTSAVLSQRVTDAKTLYCTADEAKAGYCTVGPLAGKDTNAALFFQTRVNDSQESKALNAGLNYVYGLPESVPGKEVALSPTGQAFLETKRNADALSSVSQATLKTLQGWGESREPGANATPSVWDAVANVVNRYAGGEGYQDAMRYLTRGSDHGVLVMYAKQKAAELSLRQLEAQQLELIEANMTAQMLSSSRKVLTASTGSDRILQIEAQSKVK